MLDLARLNHLLNSHYVGHRLAAAHVQELIEGLAHTATEDDQATAAPYPGAADDLALAWAAAGQAPLAIQQFERDMLLPVLGILQRRGFTEALAADALQESRIMLLVGDERTPPRLFGYRGRGPLRAYVRTLVLRQTLKSVRREASVERILEQIVSQPHHDAELESMRRHYGAMLNHTMRAAWTTLPPHDRFMLGLAFEQKWSTHQIAAACNIHRATAARRLASARAALITATRDSLQRSLGVSGNTLDSILRLFTTSVQTQFLDDVAVTPPDR